jgi:stearoyl-CoA desaturase (Delta-9 desaturase)
MILTALVLFLGGYLLNIFTITVIYHRALAHQSVVLSQRGMKLAGKLGPWITGIDPKAWVTMHRLHHTHSDTKLDPHSPVHQTVFGVALGQLRSYERILIRLSLGDSKYTALVEDLPFGVHFFYRKKIWWMPYLIHALVGFGISFAFMNPLPGLGYFAGMMSHPVQGWMVNALAHQYGTENFQNGDNSKNNAMVAFLVFGEGYQNNHHRYPRRANFAVKKGEIDFGYGLCLLAEKMGWLKIKPHADSTATS